MNAADHVRDIRRIAADVEASQHVPDSVDVLALRLAADFLELLADDMAALKAWSHGRLPSASHLRDADRKALQ